MGTSGHWALDKGFAGEKKEKEAEGGQYTYATSSNFMPLRRECSSTHVLWSEASTALLRPILMPAFIWFAWRLVLLVQMVDEMQFVSFSAPVDHLLFALARNQKVFFRFFCLLLSPVPLDYV